MKHLIISGWIMILAVSCGGDHKKPHHPVVSVSILPQKFFVDKLAGSLLDINVMVPPGASPATYEPTVQQLRKLEQSPLYLKIGYVEFELGWMDKITTSNPSMRVVDLSGGIDLLSDKIDLHSDEIDLHSGEINLLSGEINLLSGGDPEERGSEEEHAHQAEHNHSGADPHIWMSARNARIIARNTCTALVGQFPEYRDSFNLHLEQLIEEIDALDGTISSLLGPYRNGAFMIYHPALTYFARDYHLVQYPLELGGKTPSPRHMQRMVDLGKEEKISAIFIQKQFDQRNATVLAEEIGARVIQIDPLSADWSAEMIRIAEQLKISFE